MKITELTPEQNAHLPAVRDRWLAHGLATGPADRTAAQEGVRAAYQAAGLKPPAVFVWLNSPMAGCIAAAMLADGKVWDQVGDQVWAQVGAQVRDQVGAQVGAQVRAQVGAQVGAQVRDQVGAQVRDQVRDQVGAQVGDQVYRSAWGQHDAGWLSFYDAMRDLGIRDADRLSGLMQVAQNAGWWWPFTNLAVITERPSELHRDQLNRLHCETGPAIVYPDGWGFHVWHGRRVPAWVVENPTVEAIASETNTEIRRCAIESFGWPEFIAAAELAPVDACPDPGNEGHELRLYDVPSRLWGERVRVLVATNGTVERDGTRRTFGLTVPVRSSTALGAAAWGYGLTAEQYAGMQRRA